MQNKKLGQSGIEVSALGLGCWAIGGQWYGQVQDDESIRAIHCAMDMGVNFLDTAEGYGENGHSETVIGKALQGRREKMVIATKFKASRIGSEDIRQACEGSLKRLQTNYIDLYLCRGSGYGDANRDAIRAALEQLVEEGKIRAYGCSSDEVDHARHIREGANSIAIEMALNVLRRNDDILEYCEQNNLTSLCRSPLAMGMLSGKFNKDTAFPEGDIRGAGFEWLDVYFKDGKPRQDLLDNLSAVRDILTSGGRTLVQGALCWIWGHSDITIPIPGFRNVKQVTENCDALRFDPLTPEQMVEIETIMKAE